jgi:CMP/dCMP kinase
MIVTIDGPAGAGKSSAARALAQRLGFAFLDTGAMYRAVTLAALRGNCDRTDENALAQLMAGLRIDTPPGRVVLNGEDVTSLIRTPEITAASGSIASSPVVRRQLVAWQRQTAAGGDFVCEGRDQGTIVFPDALCKFFLFADPMERARRRHRELAGRGESMTLEDVLKAQQERDSRDAARDIAPMVPAQDAIQLDTTTLTLQQVVERTEQVVRTRIAAMHPLPPHRSLRSANPSPLAPRPSPLDSWMDSFWFRVWHETCYAAYFWGFTLGFSLRMQGESNLPKRGPALLIANHQSFLDPLLCGVIARRPMVYLARKTLFTNRFGAAIIRSLNAVPIDQEGVGKEGLRTILDQLMLGKAVVVFPEGERSPHGRMQALKPGIHLLIKRAQAPIVPVGIAGAFDAMPRSVLLPRPAPLFWPAGQGTLSISMGQPLDSRRYAEMPRAQALEELFVKIHAEQQRAERLRRRETFR